MDWRLPIFDEWCEDYQEILAMLLECPGSAVVGWKGFCMGLTSTAFEITHLSLTHLASAGLFRILMSAQLRFRQAFHSAMTCMPAVIG